MLTDKIKKELFQKIEDWHLFNDKICQIEDELSDEELNDNEEYQSLLSEQQELESAIRELMIDTKYLPLVGLLSEQKLDLDFFAEGYHPDAEKNIEKGLEYILMNWKDGMKNRLSKVTPLNLTTTKISPHSRIYHLYQEAVRCYIFGAFEASSALCRAISETIAKKYIETTEYKDFLYGDKKPQKETMSIGKIMKKLSVNKKTIDLYYSIQGKADKILHCKEEKTEEKEAYEIICELQNFIKKFFNEPELKIEWV